MSNLFNDLANGKYKLKGTNTVNNTNQSQGSKSNLFEDLANGKYKLKETAPTSAVSAPTSAVSAPTSAVNKSEKPTNPSDLLKRVTVVDNRKLSTALRANELENQIKQKESEYVKAANMSDWSQSIKERERISKELSAMQDELKSKRAELRDPSQDKLLTAQQVKENQKNAPLSDKIESTLHNLPRIAESTVRTAADIYGSAVSGGANAVEGIADMVVGNAGTVLSGLTSGFGLKPNNVSEGIKRGAENFIKKEIGFQELTDQVKNEGSGAYEPKVLGVKVRDIANNITDMLVSAKLGGVYGFIGSAGGKGIEEALNEGQSLNRATVYGDISGVLEGVTEKLFDAVKLVGGGKLDKFIPKGAISKLVGGAAGEGIEEMISEGLNPLIKGLTYEKGTYDSPTAQEWLSNVGQAAWQGFVVGLLLKGGQDISDASARAQYKNEVATAVEKVKGLTQQQKETIKQELSKAPEQGNLSLLALPAGNENMAYANNGNIVLGDGTVPKVSENVTYDVVNGRQTLVMPNSLENGVPNASQTQNIQRPNVTLPTQTEMAQKANMNQIRGNTKLITQRAETTLQSAKIAGANDINMNKAIELNDLLRSGAEVKFYNPQNIPQGVDANKAKVANGFYSNGTVWINKNTKNAVEVVLGHELTHHLETTDSYTDLANTILDSDVFYDYIAEKGYSNVAEYKQSLGQNYTAEQFDSEMVANFVQDKLFSDQNSIDRLARQNTTLVEKIKNWISDLVVSFKGTAQEKELRRIENMYRKALDQAKNNVSTTDARYSFAGTKAKNANFAKFSEAQKLDDAGVGAEEIFGKTGWYKGNEGRWRFEIDDSGFNIKQNVISPYMSYELNDILEAEELFEAYPELRKVEVYFDEMNEGDTGSFNPVEKWIVINNDLIKPNVDPLTQEYLGIKNQSKVFSTLMHELQHYIQSIEGFTPGTSMEQVYRDTIKTATEYAESLPAFKELKTAQEKAQFVEDYIKMTTDQRGIYSKYRNQGGEQEARNVQERIALTKEQKANTLPFIKNEDTLYANNNGINSSVAGKKAMKNINEVELINAYNEAVSMANNKVDNQTIRRETGWFQDKNGAWKFEFSDKDMKLKDDVQILRDKTYRLDSLLEHDILFTAYPQLRNCKVEFTKLRDGVDGNYISLTNTVQIDPDKVGSKADVEGIIIHELQHVIQKIEGFERGASSKKSKLAYYTSLGEIEAADTRRRLELERDKKLDRREVAPESSKANPKHEGLDDYLSKRTEKDIEKDNKFLERKAKKGIKNFFDLGGGTNEEYMGVQNNELSAHQTEPTTGLAGDVRRLAGKEPAFSMPETDNPDIRYSMNPVDVEKNKTRALSRYAQTLQSKHEDIPEQINLIQKEVDNGNFTHEVVHDKRSLNYAQKYIEENGFEDAVKHWDELIKRGKPVDKDELALGQMIYNVAVDNKDTRLVMKMASDLVQEYTEVGRNLQSATLLRKMTPDGRLYALERSVQKLNQDLMQKFDDFENIKIPEELADELLRSETQKDMDIAVEKIQTYIASKIPATWQEKLNSWRYLSMLGNPRTHIRNIIGNAVFIPAVEVKNALAQVGELAISKDQRTKAFLGKKDAKLLNYAENDFDKNHETIRGENKYDIRSGIQEKRTIYSNKALEAARKGNFNLLEAEDTLFLKYRYKKAFAGALKARGITIEQLRENSPETVRKVNEIRSYAINEAQKATYRDASIVASMISRAKRRLLNTANQSTGAAKLGYNLAYLGAEGIIPFTKTPVNIVKRGIEYSPAGLLNGVKNALFDVKSGKVTAAQAIDKIAAGATGTAIVALGSWLASMGLVNGGEEEKEKEQALKQLKGYQDYSLNIGDKSYTIDWMAPSSIPLFIGVELYNSINSNDESAYLNALSNMVEPVVEMSMLQGLNDTLTTLGEDSALGNIIAKTLTNYLGQYNPTLLGQIARTFDPVRRTTYVDKNIPVPALVQKFIQQQAAKIPGISRMLPTYKDQFGQEQLTDGVINRIVQNFTSPGYLKDIKEGAVEKGLTELYEKTGEISVIPSYASKTLTQNGEKINLTAKQYDTYAKTRGNVSKRGLEGLFNDSNYKNLTDEQKVKVVEGIYDYANKMAKSEVLENFELEDNEKKIQKLEKGGLEFYKYIMLKKTADADGNDYTSNEELDNAIKKYGLSNWKNTIKEKNTKGKNDLPTQAQQRAKLPPLKK